MVACCALALRSAASGEMGPCGVALACGEGAAGPAGVPTSWALSVPQAAAPRMIAVIVAAPAARRGRRGLVVVFMAVPSGGVVLVVGVGASWGRRRLHRQSTRLTCGYGGGPVRDIRLP